ncbi:MAG: N-acetylmuramoyl-L-alanine amidase [bacterium]
MYSKFLFFILSLCSFNLFAQEGSIDVIKENGKHFKALEFVVKKNTLYTNIVPEFIASSLTIEVLSQYSLDRSYLILGSDEKFLLTKDVEQTNTVQESAARLNNQSSALIISKNTFNNFSFYTGNIEGKVRINLLYAAPLKSSYLKDSKKKAPKDCSIAPESIDQSVWRTGLPEPSTSPTPTVVKHIILHHAAGSNTDTFYQNTVRNYYLLHTQTNGWDDIGYNYLVAPNGDIYNGRDGFQYGDDNVIGAHMCARNTNTMGICLLGNYHNTGYLPSDTAIASINQLITWKLFKEQFLNPFDSSLHPVKNPVGYLGVIAGHKEGCNAGYTVCPGDQYFQSIETRVKANVAVELSNCIALGINRSVNSNFIIYPNPSIDLVNITSKFLINEIIITDLLGRVLYKFNDINDYVFEIKNLEKGNYFIRINQKFIEKIVVN